MGIKEASYEKYIKNKLLEEKKSIKISVKLHKVNLYKEEGFIVKLIFFSFMKIKYMIRKVKINSGELITESYKALNFLWRRSVYRAVNRRKM